MDKVATSKRPQVLVTDFDRTLTYLYRDTNLLVELADKMVTHYSKSLDVPEKYKCGKMDGYFVWHELHEIVADRLPAQISEEVNRQAEGIAADFELQIIERTGLFSGIPETVKKLHSYGLRLGIVSSNATSVVKFALDHAGILDYFEYIDGRPYPFNPELIKPNPYPISKALAAMKAESDAFWYVGDDAVDMIAAKAAHVSAVGVCTGRHAGAELLEAGADLIFSSFNEIPSYFTD